MSFLTKLSILTRGAAHDLLDKAVDLNSPSMIRQYVRDLEDAIGKMNSEAAVQNGQLRTMKREQGDLAARIAVDKEAVQKIIESNPTLARSKAALIVQNQQHFDATAKAIEDQQKVADDLTIAITKLQSKHDLMVSRVRELERIDRDSKAKESASAALNSAGSIIGGMNSHSVDDLEDRMRRRNDVASAKFDQSMANIPEQETNSEDVDALLASLSPTVTVK